MSLPYQQFLLILLVLAVSTAQKAAEAQCALLARRAYRALRWGRSRLDRYVGSDCANGTARS
jgi:hypothetical protein